MSQNIIKSFFLIIIFSGGFFYLTVFAEETVTTQLTAEQKAQTETAQNNCLSLPEQKIQYFPLSSLGQLGPGPNQGVHTQNDWEGTNAVDIYEKEGTAVIAVTSGKIGDSLGLMADASGGVSGYYLYLISPDNTYYYAHLKSITPGLVSGKTVNAGDILGYSGGANNINHLHFAAQPPLNPEQLLLPFYQCAKEKGLKKAWSWPVTGGTKNNDYGLFFNNNYDGLLINSGLSTSNIIAPADGVVRYVYTGGDLGVTPYYGLGKVVVLEHEKNGETVFTLFGHCADIFVKDGQVVKQGDVIAKEGSSGLLNSLKMNAVVFKVGKALPISQTNTRDPLIYFK